MNRLTILCDVSPSAQLLDWYDRHARKMPWRVPPNKRAQGVLPDPYRVWLSEIMLQQTTVAAVKSFFETFTRRWPSVFDLAAADDGDVMAAWAGLGYYARARNLLKCARKVVAEHEGRFPDDPEALLKLPGIGPYTSAAIASIAFDVPQTVLDGNVERVIARLYRVDTPLPSAKPELMARAENLTPQLRAGDYAQAVMDLGATICTPKKPVCGLCPWRGICAAQSHGDMEIYPKKLPKATKPTRLGYAYVAQRRDGAWLLERRDDKGLLGGMLGWPGSDWGETPQPAPPISADWQPTGIEVRHTFTHFHLKLAVYAARIDPGEDPACGSFMPHDKFSPADLPTVMRKVFDAAKPHFYPD